MSDKNVTLVKTYSQQNEEVLPPKKAKLEKTRDRIVWIDCEMTGLSPAEDKLIEIAVIVTDSDLNIVAEGPNLAIHQPDEVLDKMREWCVKTHGESGLTDKVRQSELNVENCESKILAFLKELTPPGKCLLAGNSIGQDVKFLDRYMPKLMAHLHYRIIDVSTVKELCRRWYAEDFNRAPKKSGNHRALDDIRESIEELKFYRSAIFKSAN